MEQMSHAAPSVSRHYRLTPTEAAEYPQKVLALLRQCVGAMHAIPARSIAEIVGLRGRDADRKVRIIIANLIAHGYPIGSRANGFFLIQTAAEARIYLKDLEKRVISIWKRHKNFSSAAQKHFNIPYEQPRLL